MSPHLTGKPHWPFTTYEKIWGFWHFTGIPVVIGTGLVFGPMTYFSLFPIHSSFPTDNTSPLFFLGILPVFGILFVLMGLIGVADWWQLIHGTIPDPHPFARPLAYLMNEPDPWKEHAELQARLDKAKAKVFGEESK